MAWLCTMRNMKLTIGLRYFWIRKSKPDILPARNSSMMAESSIAAKWPEPCGTCSCARPSRPRSATPSRKPGLTTSVAISSVTPSSSSGCAESAKSGRFSSSSGVSSADSSSSGGRVFGRGLRWAVGPVRIQGTRGLSGMAIVRGGSKEGICASLNRCPGRVTRTGAETMIKSRSASWICGGKADGSAVRPSLGAGTTSGSAGGWRAVYACLDTGFTRMPGMGASGTRAGRITQR